MIKLETINKDTILLPIENIGYIEQTENGTAIHFNNPICGRAFVQLSAKCNVGYIEEEINKINNGNR